MPAHGRWLFLGFTVILGLTLVGDPAPTSVGAAEVLVVAGMLLLTLLGLARARLVEAWRVGLTHRSILVVVAAYCLSLLAGLGVGVVSGAAPAAAIRAAGPYLLFLPLAAAGPWLGGATTRAVAVRALVVAGAAHAGFLLVLFLTGVQDVLDLRAVFLGRTTLLDARTTVPLFLASALLPLAWLAHGPAARRLTAMLVIVASLAGALSTQTRSQLLALAAGGMVFLPCYGLWWARHRGRSLAQATRRIMVVGLLAAGVAGLAIVTVPTFRVLAQAVTMRSLADQDNGRLANEWTPALRQVAANAGTMALGIGAGQSFVTAEGESRTYVHNLGIYALVYGGVTGLVVTLMLYLVIGVALLRGAYRDPGLETAALLALLVALGVYAQFFAVHKLLSYNLMLALIALSAASIGADRAARRAPA